MADQTKKPDLSEQMERLMRAVEKSNSFLRGFFMGMVRGIGAFLGATIIAAIAFTFLWKVMQTTDLGDILQRFGIEVPFKIPIGDLPLGDIMKNQDIESLMEKYGGNR